MCASEVDFETAVMSVVACAFGYVGGYLCEVRRNGFGGGLSGVMEEGRLSNKYVLAPLVAAVE